LDKIIKHLDSVHQKLLAAVLPLDSDRFKHRRSASEWSIAEIVHHLCLVEERVIAELEKGLSGERQKPGLLGRIVPKSIVASRLVRVKAPEAVVPMNSPDKDEAIANFDAARNKLKLLCSIQGKKRLKQVVLNHPFFGKIDGTAAVSFVGYHELRHYKQIRELLSDKL